MGAFTYNNNQDPISEDVFLSRGHRKVMIKKRDCHSLAYCNKILIDNCNILNFENGDYILGVGTFVYKHKFAADALNDIFTDFKDEFSALDEKLFGHYAFVIAKFSEGKVYIFNDRSGIFRLYYTLRDRKICVSSSMISVIQNLSNPVFDKVKLSAFLCTDLGRELSIVQGVDILNPNQLIVISNAEASICDKSPLAMPPAITTLPEAVDYVGGLIKEQVERFRCILSTTSTFSVELTGGLDSRLLACMMRSGHLDYDYVHYPLFGPDKEIADLVSKKLGKELICIENPTISGREIDKHWGEFDFMFNYYRHYPNQRWKVPHSIQFSGLQGECLSNVDFQSIRRGGFMLSKNLKEIIHNPLMNEVLYEEYVNLLLDDCDKVLKFKIDDLLSDYEQSLFIQHLYVQRTGDGPFIASQNAHQYFYSVYNEYNFIHAVSNISLDVRRGRKLTIALINKLDDELASMPFVSRRRTRRTAVNTIKCLPDIMKSYNGIRKLLPDFIVDFIYRMRGNQIRANKTAFDIDYNFYSDLLSVDSLQRYPNLYSEIINRMASVEVIRKRLNIN